MMGETAGESRALRRGESISALSLVLRVLTKPLHRGSTRTSSKCAKLSAIDSGSKGHLTGQHCVKMKQPGREITSLCKVDGMNGGQGQTV